MKQEDIFALVPSWKHPGVFPVIWFELSLASFVGCVALACLLFPLSQGGKTEEQMEADKMARQKSLSRECRKNGDRPLIPRPPSMAQQARHKASHSYTKQKKPERETELRQVAKHDGEREKKESKEKESRGEQRKAEQNNIMKSPRKQNRTTCIATMLQNKEKQKGTIHTSMKIADKRRTCQGGRIPTPTAPHDHASFRSLRPVRSGDH